MTKLAGIMNFGLREILAVMLLGAIILYLFLAIVLQMEPIYNSFMNIASPPS